MDELLACPLCNSKDFKTVCKRDDLKKIYYLVECKNCGLKFINPQPETNELVSYYNEEYEVPEYQKEKIVNKAKKVLSILKEKISSGAKILEIGASHGFFLDEAKRNGLDVYGVEISKVACVNAKKLFGIEIENKDFLRSKYAQRKNFFDVIVLLDVLEHLTDQNKVLSSARIVLKRGGFLVLTLPNIDSFEFKLFGKYWEWFSPPAHLFYYSPKTVRKMLEKHDLDVVHLETYEGDSAGSLLFHLYLSLKQLIFYNLKYILGKNKLLQKREHIRRNLKEKTSKSGKEFVGFDRFIFKIAELLWKPFKFIDTLRFKRGKGQSILVLAVKK